MKRWRVTAASFNYKGSGGERKQRERERERERGKRKGGKGRYEREREMESGQSKLSSAFFSSSSQKSLSFAPCERKKGRKKPAP